MATQAFDIDFDLVEDPDTKDFKELYNVDAVNQAIDVWILMPYRIGRGTTSSLISQIFRDIRPQNETVLKQAIQEEFRERFQMIRVLNLDLESDPNKRQIWVSIDWRLKDYQYIAGQYARYWIT